MTLKEALKYMTEAEKSENQQGTGNQQNTEVSTDVKSGNPTPQNQNAEKEGQKNNSNDTKEKSQKDSQNNQKPENEKTKKELFETFSNLITTVKEAKNNLDNINKIISQHQGWQQFKNGNALRGVSQQGQLRQNYINNLGNTENLSAQQKNQINSIDNKGDIQTIFIKQFENLTKAIEGHLNSMNAAAETMKKRLNSANVEQAKNLNQNANASNSKALNNAGVTKNQNSTNQGGNQ